MVNECYSYYFTCICWWLLLCVRDLYTKNISVYNSDMCNAVVVIHCCYVAAKATYIRLLHGKIGFLGGGDFGPSSLKKGSDPYSTWMKYVVCLHLYIPWKFVDGGLLPAELRGRVCLFCFFLFFLFVRHTTMLGTESLDGAYTHWTWGERA